MKTIYLVRHAKSSWSDPNLMDFQRPLNKRGKRDAPFMAEMISNTGVKADALISSHAKRALATAKHFARELGHEKTNIKIREELYHALPGDILELIQSLPEKWNTVFIFGHNPTFTEVANTFTDNYLDNVPTCGIVRIDAETATWKEFGEKNARLSAFYYPKQFIK